MKRKILSRILPAIAPLALLTGLAATLTQAQTAHTVTIDNRSNYGLYHVYLSPASSDYWGMDQLGDSVVPPGYRFTLLDRFSSGVYDLKLVDTDGNSCVVSNVRVNGITIWDIYTEWLLGCEFH